MTNTRLLQTVLLGLFAVVATSDVGLHVDENEVKENGHVGISEAAAKDETRSYLDPFKYFINVTMINHGSVEAKVQQRYLFPDGVEVKMYTLQNDGYSRAKRSADNQQLKQWVGGSVNLKISDSKEADMIYVNHPAEIVNPNSKTFHKLSTTIMVKEGTVIGGQIFSPNYPYAYPNGADLTWLIVYPNGNIVKLEMEDYATEECCDRLVVYDGYNQSHYPLATFEGYYSYGSENTVYSSQPAMLIRFTSDCLLTNRGFRANYINQHAPSNPVMSCGYVHQNNGNEGYVQSPNYPSTYDTNMNCTWNIATDYNTRVKFVITNFYTGSDDKVSLYDSTGDVLIRQLSGSYPNGYTVYASSYQAYIIFTSGSYSNNANKFVITYSGEYTPTPETTTDSTTAVDYCGNVGYTGSYTGYINSPNYPNQYPPNSDCTWAVTTEYGSEVAFVVRNFNLPSGDYVYVYDGSPGSYSSYVMGLTGNYYPGYTIKTNSNQGFLRFYSRSYTYSGYYFRFYFYGDVQETTTEYNEMTTYAGSGGTYYDPPQCNGNSEYLAYSSSGYIYSTGYSTPGYYPNNEYCIWYVTVSGSYDAVYFHPHYFSTEPGYDWVRIYDGHTTSSSNLVAQASGYVSNNEYVVTNSRYATLTFSTDGSVTDRGFNIHYYGTYSSMYSSTASPLEETTVYDSCPYVYEAGTSGYVYSPNYPNNYGNNMNCSAYVNTPYGTYVRLTVQTFFLSTGDYLRIYDGITNQLLAVFSGSKSYGETWLSSSYYIRLEFDSDFSYTGSGYQLRYDADYGYNSYTTISPSNCGATMPYNMGNITSPYYPYNYGNNLDCIWTVTVSSNMYTLFTIQYFETESCCDNVGFYSGTSDYSNGLVRRIEGYVSPGTEILVQNSNSYVTFYTDGSVTDKGFSIQYTNVPTNYVASTRSVDVKAAHSVAKPERTNSESKAQVEDGPRTLGVDLWANAKHKPKHLWKAKKPQVLIEKIAQGSPLEEKEEEAEKKES